MGSAAQGKDSGSLKRDHPKASLSSLQAIIAAQAGRP